jgi:hypothetical protein
MANDKSIMEELYTDTGGFDHDRAVSVLKHILNVQRGEHMVFFKPELALKAEEKILAFALVKKLLKMEGAEQSSSISGKEVKKQTDVKEGTVDFTMKKLKEDGFLAGSGSNYEIPAHRVSTILDRLEKVANGK